ncbi:MAG: Rpp14/Pop5 family protein [Natronomonas sp.]
MKHLPKYLRPRWRYLAVEIETWPEAEITRRSFQRAVWYAAGNLLGDAGSAAIDGTVLGFEHAEGITTAIVRAHRGQEDRLRAAIATIDEIDGEEVGVVIRGVSGTVRACEEKYIRRPRERLDERNVAFDAANRPAMGRNDRYDVRLSGGYVGATALDIRDN